MAQTILYARVSTSDQDISHQLGQALSAGFTIDDVIADEGVSGITTKLADRPNGRRLFDRLRSGDVLVVRWVDRLGRDYRDVTDTIRRLIEMGVVIRTVINDMTFDGGTSDPVQMAVRDALIAFMAATAQAQAEATRAAQRAGIDAAKQHSSKYPGRKPSYSREQLVLVISLLHVDAPIAQICRDTGLSRQAITRIRDNRASAEAALCRWGM